MVRLSLEDAMKLLAVQTIPGKPRQLVRFLNWMERLVETRGESFVLANRSHLLSQWEEFSQVKFKNCV
ncbi:MAG: hypothetical protein P8075_15195 [Deltaproteobacteria bacterium]